VDLGHIFLLDLFLALHQMAAAPAVDSLDAKPHGVLPALCLLKGESQNRDFDRPL